jgi:hypothetical protein
MIALSWYFKVPVVVVGINVFIILVWTITGWTTSSPEERSKWGTGGWDD